MAANHPSTRLTLAQGRLLTNHFSRYSTAPIPFSGKPWQHYDLCRLGFFLSAIGLAFVSTDFGSHQWSFGSGNRDPVFRLLARFVSLPIRRRACGRIDLWCVAVERQESVLVLPLPSERGYEMAIDRSDASVAEYPWLWRSPASLSCEGSV